MSFTKSTEDIKVHEGLSDTPIETDGISPADLKELFDKPGVTVQDDLNTLIDELEYNDAASSLGANKISEADTSDNNVQAKLEHLQSQVVSVVLNQIPDNTITEVKLESTFNSKIGKKDGTLQTNLNAEKLNGLTLAQLYSGANVLKDVTLNGETETEIEIGFSPKAVIIIPRGGSSLLVYFIAIGDYAISKYSTLEKKHGVTRTTNGIKIPSMSTISRNGTSYSTSSVNCICIAIR